MAEVQMQPGAAPIKARKKIGLALGSGGVRGIAHVGVIRSLLRHNIPIDFISGTSIGAWVGSYYAATQNIEALEKATLQNKREKFSALIEPGRGGGFVKGKKVEKLLRHWFDDLQFEQLQIPVTVVATDLASGLEVDINSGPIVPAVRASMAIPMVFQPVPYNGKMLVDGGIINPVPDNVVRDMGADVVIAVNLDRFFSETGFPTEKPPLIGTGLRTFQIVRHYLAENSKTTADVIIEPPIEAIGFVAWKQYFTESTIDRLITTGEKATDHHIETIKRLIAA